MNEYLHVSACIFRQAATYILRAFYSADIGITTETTSNVSNTCVVLELVAGQPCLHTFSQHRTIRVFPAAVESAVLLTMTVNIACEMHVNVFQCIAQPNTTLLDCILYLYDPGITRLCISVHPWERVSEI